MASVDSEGTTWITDRDLSYNDVYNILGTGPGVTPGKTPSAPIVGTGDPSLDAWIKKNNTWSGNYGQTSPVRGYGGGGGTTNTNQTITPGYTAGFSPETPVFSKYTPSALPVYQSTYVPPDENKIASLAMTGGGNALKASIANLVNRTLASSSGLPLAVRNAQMRGLTENIASTYSTAMPNIRKGATSEWSSLYGIPQSRDIANQNTMNMQAWQSGENIRSQEYMNNLKNYYGSSGAINVNGGTNTNTQPVYPKSDWINKVTMGGTIPYYGS
jgi:hypothetical protein